MTSATDTAGHPDVEELSELTEGLLPASRTTDVRQHLDGCTLCSDVYDSLREIREVLGALPEPARMPADVASRIDAALAAEALLGAGTTDEKALSAASAPARVSRETPASADRPSGRPRSGSGPGRTVRTRRRRAPLLLGTLVAAAALGLGAVLVQVWGHHGSGSPPQASAPRTDAKHTYSVGTLQGQVTDLLAAKKTVGGQTGSAKPWAAQSEPGTGSSGMQSNQTFKDAGVTLPSCVEKALHTSQAVLAADQGVYQGKAVYLVVTPDASDSSKVTAFLVDSACVKPASSSPGKVLLTTSYSRP
ncbi:hypothetical protein AB0C59_26660 [Streptomyces sp. NPDC048664]|uniref:anti-sigma factor family protein n=1 Tax=Streptomyces sp. NPDC048664 TaxID=3154505 RepID=UPI00343FB91F